MSNMEYDAIVVGRGGQGTKLAAHIVAWAGALQEFSPLHYSVYDGLIRGGNIASTIVMSRRQPGVPVRSQFSTMVALSSGWFDRFYALVQPGGHVLYEPGFVPAQGLNRSDVIHRPIEFFSLAAKSGDGRAANMVAAGVLAAHWGVLQVESLERSIHDIVPPHRQDRVDANILAMRTGFEFASSLTLPGREVSVQLT